MSSNGNGAATKRSDGAVGAEAQAKRQAADVVRGYREVAWEAVRAGDAEAVARFALASQRHAEVNEFLDAEGGTLGAKLRAGLDRFHAEEVAPHLADPQVLWNLAAKAKPAEKSAPEATATPGLSPRKRPNVTVGHTMRMNTGCGNLYVTVNEDAEGRPFELFNHMGKAGGCAASQNEAIGRLISYALRCGARIEPLVKQLKGVSCHRPAWAEDGKIASCSDAIGKALEKYLAAREVEGVIAEGTTARAMAQLTGSEAPDGLMVSDYDTPDDAPATRRATKKAGGGKRRSVDPTQIHAGACLECGGQLSYEEGCVKCHSCGFTECG